MNLRPLAPRGGAPGGWRRLPPCDPSSASRCSPGMRRFGRPMPLPDDAPAAGPGADAPPAAAPTAPPAGPGDASDLPVPDAPEGGRPDVYLVVFDTLRADHLSVYGHPNATSPNLDALGERLRFARAYAQSSWTLASFSSLLTGQYPHQHRVARDSKDPALRLPRARPGHRRRGHEAGGLPHRSLRQQHLPRSGIRPQPGLRHLRLPRRHQQRHPHRAGHRGRGPAVDRWGDKDSPSS